MSDTNEHSPRPWRVEESIGGWKSFVVDANGNSVASCRCGGPTEQQEKAEAIAALIVDAVNERAKFEEAHMEFPDLRPVIIAAGQRDAAIAERDRLRDIVRRLLPLAETTVENIRSLGSARFPFVERIKSDRLRGDIQREVSNAEFLLREARAAIGEDTP